MSKKSIEFEFQDETPFLRFILRANNILDRVFEKITLPFIIFGVLCFAAHTIIALVRGNFIF